MTPETKIGLLIGLGFIIVFAILLSHSTPPRQPGDDLGTVIAHRGDTDGTPAHPAPGNDTVFTDPPASSLDAEAAQETATAEVSWPADEASDLDLPELELLEPDPPARQTGPGPMDDSRLADVHTETDLDRIAEIFTERVAPPLVRRVPEPAPGARPDSPSTTGEPRLEPDQEGTPEREVAEPPPAPDIESLPPKQYVVEADDNLGKIATKFYGTSKPRVLDFLVEANAGRIKNKDFVVVGQEILIPPLPERLGQTAAETSDPTAELAVELASRREASERRRTEQTAPEFSRHAPEPALVVSAEERGSRTSEAAERSPRMYEIRPNDSFIKIAREQLGDQARWQEIQELNEDLDPTKLQPGEKIKLPAPRRPRTDAGGARHSSA